MKNHNEEQFLGFCTYCKDEIYPYDGYVYKKGKFFHLKCYHTIMDIPLEIDEENEEFFD